MSKVLIPLAKGFEEIEAVCIIDVLRRAEINVVVAGVGTLKVSGAHRIQIETECLVSDVKSDELDMIILPGGWGGTKILSEDPDVQALLQEMDEQEKLIGAICAAPFALEKAGVLKQNYTCYPSMEYDIREEGYTTEKDVVTDANVMTSKGPATAICFALAIVEKLKGEKQSKLVQEKLLVPKC